MVVLFNEYSFPYATKQKAGSDKIYFSPPISTTLQLLFPSSVTPSMSTNSSIRDISSIVPPPRFPLVSPSNLQPPLCRSPSLSPLAPLTLPNLIQLFLALLHLS